MFSTTETTLFLNRVTKVPGTTNEVIAVDSLTKKQIIQAIKETTREDHRSADLRDLENRIAQLAEDHPAIAKEYFGTFKMTFQRYTFAEAEDLVVASPQEYVTLGEWLAEQKITLTKGDMHRLANQVSADYRKAYDGRKPTIVSRSAVQPDGSTHSNRRTNGYLPEDFPILKKALKKLQQGKLDYKH